MKVKIICSRWKNTPSAELLADSGPTFSVFMFEDVVDAFTGKALAKKNDELVLAKSYATYKFARGNSMFALRIWKAYDAYEDTQPFEANEYFDKLAVAKAQHGSAIINLIRIEEANKD